MHYLCDMGEVALHVTFFFRRNGSYVSKFPTGSRGALSFSREPEGGRVTFSVAEKIHPPPVIISRSVMWNVLLRIQEDRLAGYLSM